MRDLLVRLGLQEVATYRMTSPEREAKRFPADSEPDPLPYVRLANPIVIDRTVMRHSLLTSLLEVVERNARLSERIGPSMRRIGLFELGPVYLASEEGVLPDEPLRLGIVLTGPRNLPSWQQADTAPMDFYDLKGILEQFLDGLHLENVAWQPAGHPSYHPGKCARILAGDRQVGVAGELHPLVRKNYDLPETPLLVAEFDVSALLETIPERYRVETVPSFPPVLEDLAIIVDESVPAGAVETVIRQAGGKLLADVRLFDVYRSPALGAGKKSLAYSLAYQAADRTLQDKDAQKLRQRILQALERELGAKLRG
jgi:phenylalanyl-tRNA synthetase beta chain